MEPGLQLDGLAVGSGICGTGGKQSVDPGLHFDGSPVTGLGVVRIGSCGQRGSVDPGRHAGRQPASVDPGMQIKELPVVGCGQRGSVDPNWHLG